MGPEESAVIADEEFTSKSLGMTLKLSELFRLDADKYLGATYAAKFPESPKELVCLLKVLSVQSALSI